MMKKLLPLAAVLLLPAPLSTGAAAAPPAVPSFGETVEVNVVNVDVFVTDKNGNRVTGLKKGDFDLLEDGKAVAVSNFVEITPAGKPAAREAPPAAPPAPGTPVAAAPVAASPAAEAPADPQRQLSLVVFVDNLHIRPPNRT